MKRSIVCIFFFQLTVVTPALSITYRALQQIRARWKEKKECVCMPESYVFSMYHYPKFFSDKNTAFGAFADRSFLLTGTSDSWRSTLADNGVYVNTAVYQFLGTNCAGGADRGSVRYNGRAEYWALFDMGQMNFWSKGAFLVRGESSWLSGTSINADAGTLLDVNVRSTPNFSRLAEFFLAQFITDSFVFRLGKVDVAGPFEAADFANNSRYQFIYDGLVNNPLIGKFNSDVPMGFMPTWIPSKFHQIMLFIGDVKKNSDESSFEPLFNKQPNFLGQYTFSPVIKGRPGSYRFVYAFQRKPITAYPLDQKRVLGKDVGPLSIATKCSTDAIMINFDQYIWVNDSNGAVARRHFLPDLGVLVFGRAGWAPKDRTTIDQAYSFGLGCYGGPRERYYDQWGVGYAATHIAQPLRQQLKEKGVSLHAYEHALELFYNAELTPALHLTADFQVIRPPLATRNVVVALNTRLQADF